MAMVLDDALQGRPFEVVGSDISTRVLAKARTGTTRCNASTAFRRRI